MAARWDVGGATRCVLCGIKMDRITDKLFALTGHGAEPPQSWGEPIKWRPREFNKRADYLCNQCLYTFSSFEYTDPDANAYVNLNPNWLIYTDVGCRGRGASAYSWLLYAVVRTAGEWTSFAVSFGYTWVSMDQSSFVVEAQGLDSAMTSLCGLMDIRRH